MKKLNFGVVMALTLSLTSCAMFKKEQPKSQTPKTSAPESTSVQTESKNQEAVEKAASLTSGWPESSIIAAREMVEKYGDPQETTSNSLIWRNIAPFKEIIVHKEVYSHRFPLLHQNSLEHVVDYKAPTDKIDDVWRYNGSIVLNQTKGQMSSYAESEAMNVLALNLANQVMTGKMSSDAARVTFGKETMNHLNGKKTAYTQVLGFGTQFNTPDEGVSITNKIKWVGDPANQRRPAATQPINTRQAQEVKK
jgi:hypothetical protein